MSSGQPGTTIAADGSQARELARVAGLLGRLARVRRRAPRRRSPPRTILHVSPILFGEDGTVGGGERAAYGFAQALASELPTTLAATGPRRDRMQDGDLSIEIYRSSGSLAGQRFDPLCYRLLEQIRGADVVHCHQYRVAVSQLAILTAAALGKRAFVTDLGGVGVHFDPRVPVERSLDGVIAVSEFSRRKLPSEPPAHVIPTGVNELFVRAGERRASSPAEEPERVLYVGRVMRHKGIDVLIRGLPEGVGLDVIGRVYDEQYLALLEELAVGRDVRFVHDASDEQLADAYCRALVTVLPSVYSDAFGGRWEMPELLGCVLQESMACGTPVICSDVGGMPEIVEHEVSGFVVPASDPAAIGRRIAELRGDRALHARMGRNGREQVLERFTWPATARRVLAAYNET